MLKALGLLSHKKDKCAGEERSDKSLCRLKTDGKMKVINCSVFLIDWKR